jgi:GTP cyclohydrolase II
VEEAMETKVNVQKLTCARIPTPAGEFQLCYYGNSQDNKEHLALVMGDVLQRPDVLVRIHSECFTGDVLGSLRCDCGPQLYRAMELIAAEGRGIIIYLRQEGRGIGLLDKLRAYNLQDEGYDTVDANLMLGHQADERDYTIAALMLRDLGVASLRLMTNNPSKIEGLRALGLNVSARMPLQTGFNQENAAYLQTKVARMRHLLELDPPAFENHVNGEAQPWLAACPPPPPQRPFVTLSYAQSLDGSITAQRGRPLALSGAASLRMTHHLRARHDAILAGIGAVMADNPRLNVRHVTGPDPQPVILDSQLRLPLTAALLSETARRPWIAAGPRPPADRAAALQAAGATILRLPVDARGWVDLPALLARLRKLGIQSLMVEGGAAVINSFLQARLVDRLVLTIAPLLVGGLHGVSQLAPAVNGRAPNGIRLRRPRSERLEEDLVVYGDVVWDEETR